MPKTGKPIPPEIKKKIFELNDQGYPYYKIAQMVGVHQNTVFNYVSKYNKSFYEKVSQDHDRERGHQLKLHIEGYRECLAGWKKSCEDAKTIKISKELNKKGESIVKTQQEIKGQSGNSAFLTEARAHLASIREIMMMKKVKEEDSASAGSSEVTSALELLDQIAKKELAEIEAREKQK